MGPGGGGGGIALDPLVALDDPRKPLRSKVLAVPSLKARYLEHVRTIAEKSLDWNSLGPVVKQYRALVEKEIELDTRKLTSFDAFVKVTADEAVTEAPMPGRRAEMSLRSFADQRRKFLLDYKEAKKAAP